MSSESAPKTEHTPLSERAQEAKEKLLACRRKHGSVRNVIELAARLFDEMERESGSVAPAPTEQHRLALVVVDKAKRKVCIEPGCDGPSRPYCGRHDFGGGLSLTSPGSGSVAEMVEALRATTEALGTHMANTRVLKATSDSRRASEVYAKELAEGEEALSASEDVRALRDAIRAHENWPVGSYDRLGDLLDEVLAGRESAWRDISTAPNDGTLIVAYGPDWLYPRVSAWFGGRWEDMDGLRREPTGWLPIPPLPAAPTKEER